MPITAFIGVRILAHVREEGALRLIGRLCLLLGQRQRLVGGFEVGGALAYACFQVGIEAADVAGQPRHLDAAVAQLRDGLCQLLEEGHCRVDALAAVARHALERRHVRGLVKAVPACLGAEDFRVDQIVVEEKLPGEQVADVPVAEHERCHDVPHVVLAAVELEVPGATPRESIVSLSWQFMHICGLTRWNLVQMSCQPTAISTLPSVSRMALRMPVTL